MNLKTQMKSVLSSSPIAKARRKRMRQSLVNTDFTLLTPNCLGGILLHDLGLQFLTPTINLMMSQTDFLVFVLNLDEYLKEELVFYKHSEYSCPCAYIHPDTLPQISVNFTHYKTEEEARCKWFERAKRINRENMFVFIEERDGINYESLKMLSQIDARGIVAFTCNSYPDLSFCVYLEKYHTDGQVGNILAKSYLDDSREYEKFFNFVKWFNEANGKDYNVRPFIV